MKFETGDKIIMIGVGGSGMRGLATLFAHHNIEVLGFDDTIEVLKDHADMTKIDLRSDKTRLNEVDWQDVGAVVYSDAVRPEHILRKEAKSRGVRQLAYSEALGDFSQDFQVVAVAGTHGKTSTTAMLSHILIEAGLDPTVIIGSRMPEWGGNARVGMTDLLIVEADEYMNHFHSLRPFSAIITNIDWDHTDFFTSLRDTEDSFEKFIESVDSSGIIAVPEKTVREHDVINWPWNTRIISKPLDRKIARLPGEHMRWNAALAVHVAESFGVSQDDATRYLDSFSGVDRRLEELGKIGNMRVVSDYGHHPTEIAATLSALRGNESAARILVLVEIHTLQRLEVFFDQFTGALENADEVIFVPVFVPKGREVESGRARELLEKLAESFSKEAHLVDFNNLSEVLQKKAHTFEIALAFTAGRLDSELRAIVS